VRDGRLILDGKGAYFRTDPLPVSLGAKTLEAWVAPTTLDQHGGGVVSVESTDVHGFDAIVFAEKEPRRWLAGSNFGLRSENVGGPDENAQPGELVHLAIVYGADNGIAIYRNGVLYGRRYVKGEMKNFEAGKARILLGLRHKGAGSGFFAGEIEEARLYDRALTAEEVAASFHAGAAPVITPDEIAAALTPEQRNGRAALVAELEKLRAESAANPSAGAWTQTLTDAAQNSANPFNLWARLEKVPDAAFPEAWQKLTGPLRAGFDEARKTNGESFSPRWNLAGADYAKWFHYGPGLADQSLPAGEFHLEPDGDRILTRLQPGGALTDRLSDNHTGLLTSPRFKIETDSISVRAFGSGGAMVRVIVDNYPLPSNSIFPKAILEKSEPGWVRLDTAYRKGSWAYIEFGTREDLSRPLQDKAEKTKGKTDTDEASHFGVDQIVFHNGKDLPADQTSALVPVLDGPAPNSATELARAYGRAITSAVLAWRDHQLTEAQRLFLDALVHRGVLPTTLTELEPLRPLVAEYRRLEAEVPELRHAPGVLETAAYDAPLLPRGDHLHPGDPIPRAYLEVFGGQPYRTSQSGRRELADAFSNPQNPLTARVMANRIWSWIFGRGIVPTVDNFGRLGERPTHPELLDFLAARLVEKGWSIKDTIRYLVTTRAFAMTSEPSATSLQTDPANDWLSHMRVRRLEAESIRDSLLAVSGALNGTMYGKSADADAPRRSIYLQIHRTKLNPFLQVFDAPKPFTTLGRRDATNVPAQSLTMLNSPFVIDQAGKWAQALVHDGSDCAATRLRRMFVAAFGRSPTDEELATATEYLSVLRVGRKIRADQVLTSVPVWEDFAQSLFNLKEFIYLR